jgi:hypothetical protein
MELVLVCPCGIAMHVRCAYAVCYFGVSRCMWCGAPIAFDLLHRLVQDGHPGPDGFFSSAPETRLTPLTPLECQVELAYAHRVIDRLYRRAHEDKFQRLSSELHLMCLEPFQ